MGETIFLVISIAFFSILQLSIIPFSGLLLSSSSYLSFSTTNEKPIITEITTSVYAQPDIEEEGETGTEMEQTEGDDDIEVPDDGRPDDGYPDPGPGGENECQEGEFFNPETEQCEEIACYPNQATEIYDQGTGRCIPLPNGFEHCPPGTVYDSTSNSARCVIPAQG